MTILNTWVETVSGGSGYIVAGIFMGILALALLICAIAGFIEGEPIGVVGIIGFVFFVILSVMFFLESPKVYETRHLVTFDNSISINEVYEKYDVIEQQGSAFIIADKEEEG